jgi:dCTP diphosphatase
MSHPPPKTPPNLEDLSAALRAFNADRAWGAFHTPKDLALALNVEAAEVLELFLWSGAQTDLPPDRLDRLRHEAADVLICLLNLCDRAGIDLAQAFLDKLALNAQRYPVERAYGNAKKYDEHT